MYLATPSGINGLGEAIGRLCQGLEVNPVNRKRRRPKNQSIFE
jgi:hypothetical protein